MFKSSSAFDKLLDKSTSLTNLEPDWNSILQICDLIRQNDVQPKQALISIKKKLYVTNPNVQLMALQVLESCVKNCGFLFHNEVASKQFMEEVHDVLKANNDVKVRDEILRLIQAWAHAFRNEPSYKAVQDEMKLMKAEGFQFPIFKESDAMFSADAAPQWADAECCHRCRVQFTMVVRKHHCRNCGQVFCAKCSMKNSPIPRYGIEKEVRVCDTCYDKINNKKLEAKPSQSEESKAKLPVSSVPKKTEQEIQEEEELQLALALSKSEAESKELEKNRYSQIKHYPTKIDSNANVPTTNIVKHKKSSKSKSSKSNKKASKVDNNVENEDPELARYLNRDYWEQRTAGLGDYEHSPSPSAPQPTPTSKIINSEAVDQKVFKDKLVNASNGHDELESFTTALRSTIEIFVNRLNSNKLRGRPITNDHGVQSLFMNLTNLHSQLIMYIQQTNEGRTNCERLQDKISQIRDARAALDALREEHREQMRRAAEEADRIRQQQMAQKLEIMRKKKQEYLQYQREIALQRMHEQERELLMKSEQLKFASSVNPNLPMVSPQWSNMPATVYPPTTNLHPPGSYFIQRQNFAAPQPPPIVNHANVVNGPYIQANGSNMVAANPSSVVHPVQSGSVPSIAHSQVQQQFVPIPPAHGMYLPPTNYQPEQPQQSQQPPLQQQYAVAPPPQQQASQSANQQPPPPQPQQQQQQSAINEELLIKFD